MELRDGIAKKNNMAIGHNSQLCACVTRLCVCERERERESRVEQRAKDKKDMNSRQALLGNVTWVPKRC